MEQELKMWKRICENIVGTPINDLKLYTLYYADDPIVLCQDYQDLEYMTSKLIKECQQWMMEVIIKKNMCNGEEQQNLVLAQQQKQQINHCKNTKFWNAYD